MTAPALMTNPFNDTEFRYGCTDGKIVPPEGIRPETMMKALELVQQWDECEGFREEEKLVVALFDLFKKEVR